MNTLPGFFTPDTPNADANVSAFADGSVELVLLDNEPATLSQEGYRIQLDQVLGGTQTVILDASALADSLLVVDAQPGLKRLVVVIRPSQFMLPPGNYILLLLKRGREVLRRSLTVPSRPPA